MTNPYDEFFKFAFGSAIYHDYRFIHDYRGKRPAAPGVSLRPFEDFQEHYNLFSGWSCHRRYLNGRDTRTNVRYVFHNDV